MRSRKNNESISNRKSKNRTYDVTVKEKCGPDIYGDKITFLFHRNTDFIIKHFNETTSVISYRPSHAWKHKLEQVWIPRMDEAKPVWLTHSTKRRLKADIMLSVRNSREHQMQTLIKVTYAARQDQHNIKRCKWSLMHLSCKLEVFF